MTRMLNPTHSLTHSLRYSIVYSEVVLCCEDCWLKTLQQCSLASCALIIMHVHLCLTVSDQLPRTVCDIEQICCGIILCALDQLYTTLYKHCHKQNWATCIFESCWPILLFFYLCNRKWCLHILTLCDKTMQYISTFLCIFAIKCRVFQRASRTEQVLQGHREFRRCAENVDPLHSHMLSLTLYLCSWRSSAHLPFYPPFTGG